MAKQYPSHIAGDDTTMDSPDATLYVSLDKLEPQQALAVMRAHGLDNYADEVVGKVVKGEKVPEAAEDSAFYVPIEAALTAMMELNICGLGEATDEEVDEAVAAAEAKNE